MLAHEADPGMMQPPDLPCGALLMLAHEADQRGLALNFYALQATGIRTPDDAETTLRKIASGEVGLAAFATGEGIEIQDLKKFAWPPHPIVESLQDAAAPFADDDQAAAACEGFRAFYSAR